MKNTSIGIKLLKILMLIELYHSVISYIYPDSFYFLMLHRFLRFFIYSLVTTFVLLHLKELNYILTSTLNVKHFIIVISSKLKNILHILLTKRKFSRDECYNQKLVVQNEDKEVFEIEPSNYHHEGIGGKAKKRIAVMQILEVLESSLPIPAKKILVRWAKVDKFGLYTAGFLVMK